MKEIEAKKAPYKNITELIFDAVSELKPALRFSGANEAYISGASSDYEKLLEFFSSHKKLSGHISLFKTNFIIKELFGISETVEIGIKKYGVTAFCELIWKECNGRIEENNISRNDIPEIFPEYCEKNTEAGSKRSLKDFNIFISEEAPIFSRPALKRLISLESGAEFTDNSAIRLELRGFTFNRNSKKLAVSALETDLLSGKELEKEALDQLATDKIIKLAKISKNKNSLVIITAEKADISELTKLYAFLKLDSSIPKTAILSSCPLDFVPFAEKFRFETSKGEPSFYFVTDSLERDKKHLPFCCLISAE